MNILYLSADADTVFIDSESFESMPDSFETETVFDEPETVFVYETEIIEEPETEQVIQAINSDDVTVLLEQWQAEQKEYEQKVLEVQSFISDQTKNITSMFFVLVLAVGLLSGIVLAKAVWRKF